MDRHVHCLKPCLHVDMRQIPPNHGLTLTYPMQKLRGFLLLISVVFQHVAALCRASLRASCASMRAFWSSIHLHSFLCRRPSSSFVTQVICSWSILKSAVCGGGGVDYMSTSRSSCPGWLVDSFIIVSGGDVSLSLF